MLTDVKNPELYSEWREFIESPETRAAFCYLVGIAACSKRFLCHIQWKGQVRDFRFHEISGDQPYSFITNQQWLLFYFRPPAVRSASHSVATLGPDFDTLQQNPAGEWALKLKDIADVQRLSRPLRRHSTLNYLSPVNHEKLAVSG